MDFLLYQPWPFYLSLAGMVISWIGLVLAALAWRNVMRMSRLLDVMRGLLKRQEEQHAAEIRSLMERM